MKLIPIDLSDIPESRNGNLTKHRILQIEAFLESGEAAAEVTDYGRGSPENVAAALASAARRHGYAATAVCRRGRVFLLRKERQVGPPENGRGDKKGKTISEFSEGGT